MYDIIVMLFNICRFKKGPEDLPYSFALLKVTAGAFAVIRMLMHYRVGNFWGAMFETLAELLYVALFCAVMLSRNQLSQRFYQVASALFGSYALIGFAAWPATAILLTGQPGGMAFILLIGITIWFCATTSHIVYHALLPNLLSSLVWSLMFLTGFTLLAMAFGHLRGFI